MKITYEIVHVEQDKIFIIPNLHEKIIISSRITLNSFYSHVNKNWGRREIIFGFIKFSYSKGLECEWKLVKSQKTGPFWGFDYFKKYEGEVPKKFETTDFPSSSLFDI